MTDIGLSPTQSFLFSRSSYTTDFTTFAEQVVIVDVFCKLMEIGSIIKMEQKLDTVALRL